jgi:hypothetical protein
MIFVEELQTKKLPTFLRVTISKLSGIHEEGYQRPQLPVRKGRCVVCPRKEDVKTNAFVQMFQTYVYGSHENCL